MLDVEYFFAVDEADLVRLEPFGTNRSYKLPRRCVENIDLQFAKFSALWDSRDLHDVSIFGSDAEFEGE